MINETKQIWERVAAQVWAQVKEQVWKDKLQEDII